MSLARESTHKKACKRWTKRIGKATRKLETGAVDEWEFLHEISGATPAELFYDAPDDNYIRPEDVQEGEELHEVVVIVRDEVLPVDPRLLCQVCLGERNETTCFVPCGHICSLWKLCKKNLQ